MLMYSHGQSQGLEGWNRHLSTGPLLYILYTVYRDWNGYFWQVKNSQMSMLNFKKFSGGNFADSILDRGYVHSRNFTSNHALSTLTSMALSLLTHLVKNVMSWKMELSA